MQRWYLSEREPANFCHSDSAHGSSRHREPGSHSNRQEPTGYRGPCGGRNMECPFFGQPLRRHLPLSGPRGPRRSSCLAQPPPTATLMLRRDFQLERDYAEHRFTSASSPQTIASALRGLASRERCSGQPRNRVLQPRQMWLRRPALMCGISCVHPSPKPVIPGAERSVPCDPPQVGLIVA